MLEFDTGTRYPNHLDLIGSGQGSRRDFLDIVEPVVSGGIVSLLEKNRRLSEIARAQADFINKTLSANWSSRSSKTEFTSTSAG